MFLPLRFLPSVRLGRPEERSVRRQVRWALGFWKKGVTTFGSGVPEFVSHGKVVVSGYFSFSGYHF